MVLCLVVAGCGSSVGSPPAETTALPAESLSTTQTTAVVETTTATSAPTTVPSAERHTVRIALVGDVMLGRGVAPIADADPDGLFEEVRHVLSAADIAGGNLESPLTLRPHIATNPNDLTADPAYADLLANAGFDVMSVANNHSGDAGRASVSDTVDAVEATGMAAVGGGDDLTEAFSPEIIDHGGVRVAFLAFDATLAGWPAGASSPGIAHWERAAVEAAVIEARRIADIVVVSVHGGVEYLPDTDPILAGLATSMAESGADVVWGHGPHVTQPVYVEGSETLVATSLGNFVFDQRRAGTETGLLLEVLADVDGVVACRLGRTSHPDRRVHFDGWDLPAGDAVLIDGEWWTPVRSRDLAPVRVSVIDSDAFSFGDVTASSLGDVTGDGIRDLVVSYRHPIRAHPVREAFPDVEWEDAEGRSAHLGVFDPNDQTPFWAGGAMFRPVSEVVACDGTVALVFDGLDDSTVVATGGWVWNGFGFDIPPELPGPGSIGCVDIDGDGRTEPIVLDRVGGS
jgi:poly-gamma-glutamate synthesis protein (capsule biosynthesis protein)